MHFQVILKASVAGKHFVTTYGVNDAGLSNAIDKAARHLTSHEPECEIDGVEADRVSLDDWPIDVRSEFIGAPEETGVYFVSGRVYY